MPALTTSRCGVGHAASHADIELRLTSELVRGAGIGDRDGRRDRRPTMRCGRFEEAVPAGGEVAIDREREDVLREVTVVSPRRCGRHVAGRVTRRAGNALVQATSTVGS